MRRSPVLIAPGIRVAPKGFGPDDDEPVVIVETLEQFEAFELLADFFDASTDRVVLADQYSEHDGHAWHTKPDTSTGWEPLLFHIDGDFVSVLDGPRAVADALYWQHHNTEHAPLPVCPRYFDPQALLDAGFRRWVIEAGMNSMPGHATS